ncbi:hypothetical protein [Lentibacillus sp. Marseille-P4043]|uniref:hypothetical protein n=1 Tax=Lentibacillus sp. Marseille-P4043 TaxID=2040293 RepID=UPI000D0BDCA1|nr:hypothetical protein [Lentibacillus sp. Marseille-P4043]
MGRQVKGLLYFFVTDVKHSLFIFWTILVSSLVVSIVGAYLLMNVDEGRMTFALSMAIYIYCGIFGFITVKQGIPFSIKMGATRKNLFVSIGIFFLGLALAKAMLANTIHSLVIWISNGVGIDTFRFIHPSQLMTDTWLTRVTIDTAVMFFILAFMFAIGLLFYKYGLLGGGTVVGALVITVLFGIAYGWIIDFFSDIFLSLTMTFFVEVLLIGIVIYGLSWIMLRKITIEIAR